MLEGSEIFECQVCMEVLLERRPRTLTCQHVFCQECLEKIVVNAEVTCPTCRSVTPVPPGGIEELPANFFLAKVKAREEAIVKRVRASSVASSLGDFSGASAARKLVCELCQLEDPKVKCLDCVKFMCEYCRSRHDTVAALKRHSVQEMPHVDIDAHQCHTHGQMITHMCHQCGVGLCIKCVLSDEHIKHSEQVEDFSSGVEKSRKDIASLQASLKQKITALEEKLSCATVLSEETAHLIKGIEAKRMAFEDKVNEAKFVENDLLENYKQPTEEMAKNVMSIKHDLETMCKTLDVLQNRPDHELICDLPTASKDAANAMFVADVNSKLDLPKLPYFADKQRVDCSCKVTNLLVPKNIYDLENPQRDPKLVLDLTTTDDFSFQRPVDFTFMDKDSVAIADADHSFVYRIDSCGNNIAKYYLKDKKMRGRSVCVFCHCLYIADHKGILKIPMTDSRREEIEYYQPDLVSISKMIVYEHKTIVLSCREEGKVVIYNTEDDEVTDLLTGLKKPDYLSFTETYFGRRFAVTEQDARQVNVYDQNWRLITKIKHEPQRNWLLGTAITQTGSVLIADWTNKKINLYNSRGEFVKHVLTSKHGVLHPMALAFNPPYIWVAGYTSKGIDVSVRCFRVLN